MASPAPWTPQRGAATPQRCPEEGSSPKGVGRLAAVKALTMRSARARNDVRVKSRMPWSGTGATRTVSGATLVTTWSRAAGVELARGTFVVKRSMMLTRRRARSAPRRQATGKTMVGRIAQMQPPVFAAPRTPLRAASHMVGRAAGWAMGARLRSTVRILLIVLETRRT